MGACLKLQTVDRKKHILGRGVDQDGRKLPAITPPGAGFGQKKPSAGSRRRLAIKVIGTGRRDRPVCGRPVCRCCQLDMIAGNRHDLAGVMR